MFFRGKMPVQPFLKIKLNWKMWHINPPFTKGGVKITPPPRFFSNLEKTGKNFVKIFFLPIPNSFPDILKKKSCKSVKRLGHSNYVGWDVCEPEPLTSNRGGANWKYPIISLSVTTPDCWLTGTKYNIEDEYSLKSCLRLFNHNSEEHRTDPDTKCKAEFNTR